MNSIVIVKLLLKMWLFKLSNRAIAGDIWICNSAKSISIKSNMIVEYNFIGVFVIECDSNMSIADVGGVM